MDVVLKNLAKHASGVGIAFQKWFQIRPQVIGHDLVIQSRDAKKAFADRPTLRIHPRIALTPGCERNQAAILTAQIPTAVDQYRPPAPSQILIQSGFGRLSEMEEILTLVTVEHPTNLTNCVAERLLPTMVQAYGARYVTGVSIDAEYQQACMSFIKIALLSERYGIDKASHLVKHRNALAGALPHGMTVVAYVDVLTRLSPILFTLPVARAGCTWHFQNETIYGFSKGSGRVLFNSS